MKFHVWAGVVGAAALSTGALQERTKGDLDRLQGTWKVTELTHDGKKAPPDYLKGASFTVKGNRYVLKGGDDTFQGVLRVDGVHKPKTIDASFVDTEGKEKGSAYGIYALEGDQLKIAWREKGKERPEDFASKPGSGVRLIVLQRGEK